MDKQALNLANRPSSRVRGASSGLALKGILLRGKPRILFRCSASPVLRVYMPSDRWKTRAAKSRFTTARR